MTKGLDSQRIWGDRIVLTLIWTHAPLCALVAALTGKNWVMCAALGMVLAGGATATLFIGASRTPGRIILGFFQRQDDIDGFHKAHLRR